MYFPSVVEMATLHLPIMVLENDFRDMGMRVMYLTVATLPHRAPSSA